MLEYDTAINLGAYGLKTKVSRSKYRVSGSKVKVNGSRSMGPKRFFSIPFVILLTMSPSRNISQT